MTTPSDTQDFMFVRLPNWVGDLCMSLPSLNVLLATGRPVIVCARPWARELLAGHTDLSGFVPMTGKLRQDRAAVVRQRKNLGKHTARGLLLPDSLSSALVFRLAGVPSAGYRHDARSLLLRWPLNKPPAQLHAVQSWHHLTLAALQRWGLPAASPDIPPTLGLRTTADQREQALAALHGAGLQERNFVLIAPTATGLHKGRVKVWPGFAELTRLLHAQGLAVAMCPPPAEAAQARAAAPDAICLSSMALGAFATLTRMAALVVCNDSGVSHLAAAVNAPQLTLFGVTSPGRTGPWSPQAQCLGSLDNWPATQDVFKHVMSQLNPP
jgi:heptosyltransferase-2